MDFAIIGIIERNQQRIEKKSSDSVQWFYLQTNDFFDSFLFFVVIRLRIIGLSARESERYSRERSRRGEEH